MDSSNQIKICLVLPSLYGGGAEKMMSNLANHFAEKKLSVDLIIFGKRTHFDNYINKDVNLIFFNKQRAIYGVLPLISYFREEKPSSVLVTMPYMSIVTIAAKILSFQKIHVVIRQPNYLSLNVDKVFCKKCYFYLVSRIYNLGDSVIGISKGVSSDLEELGVENVKTIYNPVFNTRLLEIAKGNVDFSMIRGTALFIGVGRLVKQKNFTLLLDAFSIVRKGMDAQLLILGKGPDLKDLEEHADQLNIKGDVVFLGHVMNPMPYIKKSDVLVVSSLWEGFGNIIVEALSVKTQVVSTDCHSGPREILDNGKYGFLTNLNNASDMAFVMMKAYKNKKEPGLLFQRSKMFDVNHISSLYLNELIEE
jgi:glycosyltransferase involved in cell wall biosynthesis